MFSILCRKNAIEKEQTRRVAKKRGIKWWNEWKTLEIIFGDKCFQKYLNVSELAGTLTSSHQFECLKFPMLSVLSLDYTDQLLFWTYEVYLLGIWRGKSAQWKQSWSEVTTLRHTDEYNIHTHHTFW